MIPHAYSGHPLSNLQISYAERYFGPCSEPCHSSKFSTCHRSMPPQHYQNLDLEYDEPHNRPIPAFFLVLLNIEHGGKASCFTPPRNLLRTSATYKGNGTTYESTLSARPHKHRRCCFDTCSNSSSHSTVDLRFYAGSNGAALDLTWPHFVRVICRGVVP